MREQSRQFLNLVIRAASQQPNLDDINAPVWEETREFLSTISRSRAHQGFSPAETATFVFSLKQPLFARLRQELESDPEALADEMWTATVLLDKLGLYTTEVYPEEPRGSDRAPAAGDAGAVDAGRQAVGRHPRAAA